MTHQEVVNQWFADRGDQTLRLDYPLTPESVVFDVGGYEGGWSAAIFERYGPTIHVFEPVKRFADAIAQRFASQKGITVHRIGLAATTCSSSIALDKDGSSIYGRGAATERIQLQSAADFFHQHAMTHLDLMKINIEGCEYDLLDHLIATGLIGRIGNVQVQFHHFVPDAVPRRAAIQQHLARTHEMTWHYPFVWENWRLRSTDTDSRES